MNKRMIPVYSDKNKSELSYEIDTLYFSPLALKALQGIDVDYAYVHPENQNRKIGVATDGKEFDFPMY